jgi:hypothetical protein
LSGLAASTSYTLNYAKNGVAIAPVTRTSSTTGTIVISSLTAGTYTNINVTLNGCVSNTIGSITLTAPCAGALITSQRNTLNINESVRIYPNPFTNRFRISYLLEDNSENINLSIFNATGALLKEYKNIKSDELIDGDALPNGSLIMHIETQKSKRTFIYKLIKSLN